MQLIKWFMLVVLVWFVPTFASAQVCETRGRLEICPQTAANGSRFYIVTPQRGALYGELMTFVNEGVDERLQITAQQIDDANSGKVIYYCPGTDLCTHGFCRNGVNQVVNGDDVPRRFDTVCDGTQATASRGLVARNSYRVPAHRALTSTEVVADATTTLDNNAHPLSGDVSRALAIGIEAGSDPVHAPSALALVGLMTSVRNAQGRLATAAPVAVVPSQMDVAPAPVVASASAEAAARIVRLESDLALAQVESSQRLIALLIALGLLVLMALVFIWKHGAPKRATLVPSVARVPVPDPNLRKEWEQRIANAEGERDKAKRELAEFQKLWSAPLASLTPEGLREERGQALQFREMTKTWMKTPTLNLPFSIESLEQVIAGFAKPSSDGALLARLDTEIRDKLTGVWREQFGQILSFSDTEHRRVVDEGLVKDLFSTTGSFRNGRGNNAKRTEFHDLRAESLTLFLSTVHDSIGHALDVIDRMLGHAPEQPLAPERTRIAPNPLAGREDDATVPRIVRSDAALDPQRDD